MPKIEYIDTVEELVLNEDFRGLRQCRIEVIVSGTHYRVEVGHIRVRDNGKLFDAVCEAIRGPVEEANDEG